jgi:hypothetical protein
VLELRPRNLQAWGRGRHGKIGRWLAKCGNQRKEKSRNAKPGSKPQEGMSADKNFPYVSQIILKPHICNNSVWVETFLDQLFHNPGDGYRPVAISPSEDDRAHDHNKGRCIYWKMSKCGFRLPFTSFKKLLLRSWDVTPTQLTWVARIQLEIYFSTDPELTRIQHFRLINIIIFFYFDY